jgi:predicted ATPase
MIIDPVVLLAEDLRMAETALAKATRIYRTDGLAQEGELVTMLLGRVRRLFGELLETVPTSAIGAAELVGMAAQRLPFSYARYAAHLHEIAERLAMGQRLHSDLVWLRALQAALVDGVCGKDGDKIAPLLNLAIMGASRPIIVFRAVMPVCGSAPWSGILGTGILASADGTMDS